MYLRHSVDGPGLFVLLLFVLGAGVLVGGEEAPSPVLLWPDKLPGFVENAPAENTTANGHIDNVSIPSITAYLPPEGKGNGTAIIICPGGSYRLLDWNTHVLATSQVFNAKGIAVIGLKYRTNPPNKIYSENRGIPLMDVQRAVRTVRSRAAEWKIDPARVGVLGYSAGANLAVTSAEQFDEGKSGAEDPVERLSCRPDFVVACSVWHWKQTASPFQFSKNTPPLFMVHAADDKIAPVELPQAIKAQLEALGVPVQLEVYDKGGHGVGHLSSRWVAQGLPPDNWSVKFLAWLGGLSLAGGKP